VRTPLHVTSFESLMSWPIHEIKQRALSDWHFYCFRTSLSLSRILTIFFYWVTTSATFHWRISRPTRLLRRQSPRRHRYVVMSSTLWSTESYSHLFDQMNLTPWICLPPSLDGHPATSTLSALLLLLLLLLATLAALPIGARCRRKRRRGKMMSRSRPRRRSAQVIFVDVVRQQLYRQRTHSELIHWLKYVNLYI